MFRSLTARLLAWLGHKRGRPAYVKVDARGITLGQAAHESAAVVSWRQVGRVRVLRRDVFAGDLVSMLIEVVDGSVMVLDEGVTG